MTWSVEIENIGGIERGRATLEPGANVVRGTNWQGKSSFIRALSTALGTASPLTEGREEGRVVLDADGERVEVVLRRTDEGIAREGTPLLTDEYDVVRAELYACLGERNPVREAVRTGQNLEAVLTRPLDFQNIDERIAELTRERERLDAELERARGAARDLPAAQERVTRLETRVETLRERLDALTITEVDADDREALSAARAERDRVRSQIERLERTISRTEQRLAETRGELDALEVPTAADVASELEAARERYQSLRRDVDILQSLYSANRRVLDEDRVDLVADVERDLLSDDLTCWVCGGDASRERIEEAVAGLGERLSGLRAELDEAAERVSDLEARREAHTRARTRREDLARRIADLEATLADREESLAEARSRGTDLDDRIEALSAAVEEGVEEVTDVESDLKYASAELDDAREELAALERAADQREAVRDRRGVVRMEIEALRNRKDDLKRRAREAFDEAMREILERFDTGFETARLTPTFDLVVARDGREASLDALSEGELELLGFVAALAGHDSFEVAADVPIMLVDGLGSLADENLHAFVEYLSDRADYLVFTAHPEHTSFTGHEVSPDGWQVVSDATGPEQRA